MKMLFLILVISLLLVSPGFSQLEHYSVNIEINEEFLTHYDINLVFPEGWGEFNYPLEGMISNLEYDVTSEDAKCRSTKESWGYLVKCDFSNVSERAALQISFDVPNLVQDLNNKWMIQGSFRMPGITDSFFLSVKIPTGMALIEKTTGETLLYNLPFLPENGTVSSDGRNIIVSWERENLDKGYTFGYSVVFEQMFSMVNPAVVPIAVFGIIILIILLIWMAKKRASVKLVLPVLKSDEKRIFEAILKHGNGVNQKVIVRESNYSKAKVSKVLKSLQERGLVKLERLGRSNKVYIRKGLGKKD